MLFNWADCKSTLLCNNVHNIKLVRGAAIKKANTGFKEILEPLTISGKSFYLISACIWSCQVASLYLIFIFSYPPVASTQLFMHFLHLLNYFICLYRVLGSFSIVLLNSSQQFNHRKHPRGYFILLDFIFNSLAFISFLSTIIHRFYRV